MLQLIKKMDTDINVVYQYSLKLIIIVNQALNNLISCCALKQQRFAITSESNEIQIETGLLFQLRNYDNILWSS